jgi:PAS domain S-box-containing protein
VNLLSRLFVLVAVALLPAIAIQAYNELDLRRARQSEVQNQALGMARLAAAEQQQIVQGVRQVLITLSELPAIKAKDREACNTYLAALRPRFPAFITLLVTDANGQSFCQTRGDHGAINIAGRAYYASLLNTGTFTVGEASLSLSTGRRVLQFALPFYDDGGHIGGIIEASLSLKWLADYIAQKGVPAGAAIAITDRDGICLARYPHNDRFVGTRMPGEKYLKTDELGAVAIVNVDGTERVEGYSALGPESGGLVVSFGLDKARAFAEIQERTRRGVFLIVLSTSLVLLLTWLGAKRFVDRPLGQLVDAANRWRLGEYSRRVNIQDRSEIARVAGAFNSMVDALERREHELSVAKERAEEAAARITMIFESTTDSVIIVDRDWRIGYLNGPALALITDSDELMGENVSRALPDGTDVTIVEQLRRVAAEERPASFEMCCPHDGVWYSVNAFPSSQGLAIFFRDITEHKKALEARRLTEEQLHQSQKMESVGQLTGGIAHDFNNLLTVVSGNLELIEGATDNGRVRQFAMAARRAADRGAKLTAQLLTFSRRQKLNPKLVNANQLIAEFQGLIRQAVGGGCEVRLRTGERLWQCHIDPSLLETALLNLALNGRDAMPDGGLLEIETRNVVLDDEAADHPAGSYVRLSVTDTGSGMLPEVRDRIFEPFFTTKEVGKGTGLGLSMVYGFVRQSAGHITVDSTVGVGTTVALYLPRAHLTGGVEVSAIQAEPIPGGSERILIVDDNEDLHEVTSAMLTTLGYQVACASNGAEAIKILERGEEFELLFSDIVIPNGMSGVELAREVKRRNKGIKVLLTSGFAGSILEQNRAVNEFAIIDKPFRLPDLARRVHSILHDSQPSSNVVTL